MPTSEVSRFSHDFHVNKVGFGCVDCHNSLFQQAGSSANAADDFAMSAFEQDKYCGVCHDGSTAFAATDQGSCARCHGSGVTLPKTVVFEQPVKAVVFDHSKHAEELRLPCSSCHDKLFKMKQGESEKQPDFTMEAMLHGKHCGACHDGVSAFSLKTRCAFCHIGKQGYNRLLGKEQIGH
ncbi:c(7)-type cytochrome triheme domain-containing protein [Candidatus Electronema sp. TJ]|uniref:c(7)-type cytochrome triheme domain-containing protein n=1 Tax=Candidatus Electronema sp. TJ TaxID=3401573 RepID=UPI003AA809C8